MKTSELIGLALDWAVAKCEGEEYRQNALFGRGGLRALAHCFSTSWAQGGPIIEREKIALDHYEAFGWEACIFPCGQADSIWFGRGPTPLIAAMRCYVASKLGDKIEIPEELKP